MKPSCALTIFLFVYSAILFTARGSKKEESSNELEEKQSELSLTERRNKRDASEKEFEVYDKRPRELVGKRLRDFVGKRDSNEDGDVEEDLEEETGFADKRLRDFVGKRYIDRHDVEKRVRDFVGKRSFDEQYAGYDKRLRDFVGKRGLYEFQEPYNYIEEESDVAEKRLRDFIGKRNSRDIILRPPRELVGKRFRDFVGKRDFDKRVRDFVGKRDVYPLDYAKRIRELLG
ncbi:hypothetical protein CHS0354_016139 [Potamilus streckersoni]|uniref:Uncharacterized protein n=1 Tax=Potamilus streckersoni TaxID=2493646 RepID=A0AAE0T1G1_9BIVA|nr:hypothetical protein CHS0354_016139 [Potamilus streckersoni]